MMIISPLSARITGRFGARTTLVASTLLMTLAYAFRMTFDDTVVLIVVGSVLVSIGNALAFAVMPILIMNAVPLNETAAANGVNSLLRTVGSSSMSAVVAALLTGITVEAAGHTFPPDTPRSSRCSRSPVPRRCCYPGRCVPTQTRPRTHRTGDDPPGVRPGRVVTERTTRDAVLEVARKLFTERGFTSTTIRDIAEGAGVSPALVMKLTGSKAQLFEPRSPPTHRTSTNSTIPPSRSATA